MTFAQFLAILRARRWLAVSVVFLTVAAVVALSLALPKKYTAEASVVVDIAPDPISGAIMSSMLAPAIMATQADILSSDRVARKVIQNLRLEANPAIREQWQQATDGEVSFQDWLVEFFQRNLKVLPSRESNVITVTYKAPDPRFAATIANALIQAFLDTSVELRVDPAKQYSGFFNQRAAEASDAYAKAQARLSEYQQANGIVGNLEQFDVETSRLNDLSTQLVTLQALASNSSSRNVQAAGNTAQLSDTLANPVVGGLKVSLGQAEASLQSLQTRLGSDNPQVQEAEANIAELRKRIAAETSNVGGSVRMTASINTASVAQLQSQLEAQRAKVLKLKQAREGMSVLQGQVDNAQRAVDAIAQRQTQSSLESQTQQSNVKLLSAATPPSKASFPKWPLNIAAAVLLGAVLAMAAVFIRELTDRRIRGPQDLVELLGLPVLGVMPMPAISKRGKPLSLMAQRVISGRLPALGAAKA